jgi:hypothetical protein
VSPVSPTKIVTFATSTPHLTNKYLFTTPIT